VSAPANFDRIARPYRILEYLTLGKILERTRMHFLPRLPASGNVLVLGDGDGRFLEHLLATNLGLRATALDSSEEMLRLLRERCAPYASRLRTLHGDALGFIPPANASYDLLVTHFFLDCLTEPQLDELVQHLSAALAPDALWLFSDFRIPPGSMRWPARILVRSLYLAFRVITGLRVTQLPNHGPFLSAAGFRRIDRQLFFFGILTTELWQRESAQQK
jgi:cyclopropane fatty-acyl-phospholipid synthase-like methyltransferase